MAYPDQLPTHLVRGPPACVRSLLAEQVNKRRENSRMCFQENQVDRIHQIYSTGTIWNHQVSPG